MAPVPPLAGSYPISSGFGQRDGALHAGVDYAAPAGTAIHAVLPGRVVTAGFSSGGWGNEVLIDHGVVNGEHLFTRYAHMLSAPAVTVGQQVTAGQTLGNVGSTGDSTGNHLHFGTYVGTSDNAGAVDPMKALSQVGDTPGGILGQILSGAASAGAPGGVLGVIPTVLMALLERAVKAGEQGAATAKVVEGVATTVTHAFLPSSLLRAAAGVIGTMILCFSLWFLGREIRA